MSLLIGLIGLLLRIVGVLLLVRVVISFLPHLERTSWGEGIVALTEPILKPLRSFTQLAVGRMAFDLSPMVALLIISVIRSVLRV